MDETRAPEAARSFAALSLAGRERELRLEFEWVGAERTPGNVVVFLHEGLGSISMWREFPRMFCERHGLAGFVFSRYGYGRSTAKPPDERWSVDFMPEQANDVLPNAFRRSRHRAALAVRPQRRRDRSRSCTRRATRSPA